MITGWEPKVEDYLDGINDLAHTGSGLHAVICEPADFDVIEVKLQQAGLPTEQASAGTGETAESSVLFFTETPSEQLVAHLADTYRDDVPQRRGQHLIVVLTPGLYETLTPALSFSSVCRLV